MRNSFFRHIAFKYLLLLLLLIKVGNFVYESFSTVVSVEKTSEITDVDIDVEEDSEQQNDEKNKFDENNKINQVQVLKFIRKKTIKLNFYSSILKEYRNFYLEFTTPPPEFV